MGVKLLDHWKGHTELQVGGKSDSDSTLAKAGQKELNTSRKVPNAV